MNPFLDFQKQINEVFRVVRDGELSKKSKDELHEMLRLLHTFKSSQADSRTDITITAVENELARKGNEEVTKQALALHNELMREQRELKASIESLKEPHWTLTPAFWIAVAILIVAILAWIFPRETMKEQSNKATNAIQGKP